MNEQKRREETEEALKVLVVYNQNRLEDEAIISFYLGGLSEEELEKKLDDENVQEAVRLFAKLNEADILAKKYFISQRDIDNIVNKVNCEKDTFDPSKKIIDFFRNVVETIAGKNPINYDSFEHTFSESLKDLEFVEEYIAPVIDRSVREQILYETRNDISRALYQPEA